MDPCEFHDELGDWSKFYVYGADIVAMPTYISGISTYICHLDEKKWRQTSNRKTIY